MSFYYCIDLIDKEVTKKPPLFAFRIRKEILSKDDKEFLKNVKERLTQLSENLKLGNLLNLIDSINNHVTSRSHLTSNACFQALVADLEAIRESIISAQNNSELKKSSQSSPEYQKFQEEPYKIADLKQSSLLTLGSSKGLCYGFTFAMVDPETSPYVNRGLRPDVSQKIHDYQKHQLSRQLDQGVIKKTRLTREFFIPDPKVQAKRILNYAESNSSKHLMLSRRSRYGGHACYLSKQQEGIRYMDSNHGVYLFKRPDDFIEFYVAAAKEEKKAGFDFPFYQLAEMIYDPHKKQKETKTFKGKLRSLLTGYKYSDHGTLFSLIIQSLHFFVGSVFGAMVGVFIGSLILPVAGTIVGGLIGGLIGGFFLKGLGAIATRHGHHGLLAIPHFFREKWYYDKQKLKDNSEKSELTQEVTDETSPLLQNSTSTMLSPSKLGASQALENDDLMPVDPKSENMINEILAYMTDIETEEPTIKSSSNEYTQNRAS